MVQGLAYCKAQTPGSPMVPWRRVSQKSCWECGVIALSSWSDILYPAGPCACQVTADSSPPWDAQRQQGDKGGREGRGRGKREDGCSSSSMFSYCWLKHS